eukprot:scaffold742_cov395-Prasinococcus_capsulatus_cf.AAC.11
MTKEPSAISLSDSGARNETVLDWAAARLERNSRACTEATGVGDGAGNGDGAGVGSKSITGAGLSMQSSSVELQGAVWARRQGSIRRLKHNCSQNSIRPYLGLATELPLDWALDPKLFESGSHRGRCTRVRLATGAAYLRESPGSA